MVYMIETCPTRTNQEDTNMTNYVAKAKSENNVTRITSRVLNTLAKWAMVDVEWVRYQTPKHYDMRGVYGVRRGNYLKETGSAKETAEYLNSILADMEDMGIL